LKHRKSGRNPEKREKKRRENVLISSNASELLEFDGRELAARVQAIGGGLSRPEDLHLPQVRVAAVLMAGHNRDLD